MFRRALEPTNPHSQELADDNPELEAALGFPLHADGGDRLGWLLNVNATLVDDRAAARAVAAVNCYFVAQDGAMFKAQIPFAPYLYLVVAPGREGEVDAWLRRAHGRAVRSTELVTREDLDLRNHLAGLTRTLLKVTTWTTAGLGEVRRDALPAARRAAARAAREARAGGAGGAAPTTYAPRGAADALTAILDVREHDVPYHVRFAIDAGVRCGHWYTVSARGGDVSLARRPDLERRAEPVVCAFDIETTKLPLQFPNAEYDQVSVKRKGEKEMEMSVVFCFLFSFNPPSTTLTLFLSLPSPPPGLHDLLHGRPPRLPHRQPGRRLRRRGRL